MKRKVLAAGTTFMMTFGFLTACTSSVPSVSSGTAAASPASSQSAASISSPASSEKAVSASSSASSKAAASEASSSSLSGEAQTDQEMNIMVILKTSSSEVGKYLQIGAESYEKAHPNIHVDVTGATSETSYDEQMNMIESAVTSGKYDALVLDPLQADAAGNVLKDCSIPVISFDTDISGGVSTTYVGVGNEKAAKLGAETGTRAAKDLGWQKLQCIEIAGVQGDPTCAARILGYKEGVTEAGGEFLEDEIQYADSVADKAVNCMEGIMSKYPDGVAIIACHNDDMAIAAAKVASGNKAYQDTVFIGFDGMSSAAKAIADGTVKNYYSVSCDWHGMTYKAVDCAVRAVLGETLPDFVSTDYEIMDAANAQARVDELQGYLDAAG